MATPESAPSESDVPQGSQSDIEATVDADAAVERARAMGRLLDDAVRVPGTGFRIGLDPILGIAPVSGDAVAAAGALYIVLQGYRVGMSPKALASMVLLIALDFLVGSIPVVGTVVDAVTKVNRRNAARLEAHVGAQS
jgi:hypothetical protein